MGCGGLIYTAAKIGLDHRLDLAAGEM